MRAIFLTHLLSSATWALPSFPCIFQGERASYRELNARANRLARHLQTLGVRPGDLVGVMVDRSIDMLVALVAVHKTGAAYVPLDPTYPPDRLAYMSEDSGARIVITRTWAR